MQARRCAVGLLVSLAACSSSANSGSGSSSSQISALSGTDGSAPESAAVAPAGSASAAVAPASSASAAVTPAGSASAAVAPAGSASAAGDSAGAELVTFSDPDSGFETSDVLDADREVMQFDAAHSSLVWAADGARVDGWVAQGDDLSWTGSGVDFQVRFGSEAGERHAYFTEAASGTICNLELNAAGQLSIFGTSELPPQ